MRCSLNLQLRSAHEKPQQLNQFDSPIDADVCIDYYLRHILSKINPRGFEFFDPIIGVWTVVSHPMITASPVTSRAFTSLSKVG